MPAHKHPLPKVLPIRLTNTMLESIRNEAIRLQVRPHDVARIALGIGLKALLEGERLAIKEYLETKKNV
jgi:hypothetical protein